MRHSVDLQKTSDALWWLGQVSYFTGIPVVVIQDDMNRSISCPDHLFVGLFIIFGNRSWTISASRKSSLAEEGRFPFRGRQRQPTRSGADASRTLLHRVRGPRAGYGGRIPYTGSWTRQEEEPVSRLHGPQRAVQQPCKDMALIRRAQPAQPGPSHLSCLCPCHAAAAAAEFAATAKRQIAQEPVGCQLLAVGCLAVASALPALPLSRTLAPSLRSSAGHPQCSREARRPAGRRRQIP